MLDFHAAAKRLGPPKPGDPLEGSKPAGTEWCACGVKTIPVADLRPMMAGVVFWKGRLIPPFPVLDNICRECRHDRLCDFGRNTVRLVCVTCRQIVGNTVPNRFKGGFRFEAGRCYHVDACPGCRPGAAESKCVEKEQYDRAQGVGKIII